MILINFLEEGEVILPKRSTGWPSLPRRIFPKFHLMFPLSGPLSPMMSSYSGCLSGPFTLIFEYIGKDTPYLDEQNA